MKKLSSRSQTPRAAQTERGPAVAFQDLVDLLFASARSPRQRERLFRAAGASISKASLNALAIVRRHAPLTVSDLAGRLEIDQSTASRQVATLERLQLVTRAGDPRDRRVAQIVATARGRRLLDRVREVSLYDFEVAMSEWSPADRVRFANLLDRFRAGLLGAHVDDSGWAVQARSPQSRDERRRLG